MYSDTQIAVYIISILSSVIINLCTLIINLRVYLFYLCFVILELVRFDDYFN